MLRSPPHSTADTLRPLQLLHLPLNLLGVPVGQVPPLSEEALLLELSPLFPLALAGPLHARREPVLARAVVLLLRRVREHAVVHGVREGAARERDAEGAVAGAFCEGCFSQGKEGEVVSLESFLWRGEVKPNSRRGEIDR